MAMVVMKTREIVEMRADELQKALKDEVAKSKIFSWLYIK
jgi:hypothetical protein